MSKEVRSRNLKTVVVLAATTLAYSFACKAYADATTIRQPVLRPESFFGQAKLGYTAAQQAPEVCAKLFCYCGCDITDNHSSLLDCFTSDHGVDCQVCQEEAIIALKMKNEHKSIADIQKVIDLKYIKEYEATFSKPSEALKTYRANRLWKPDTVPVKEKDSSAAPATTDKANSAHHGCCSTK